jgi:hypothetical protein
VLLESDVAKAFKMVRRFAAGAALSAMLRAGRCSNGDS